VTSRRRWLAFLALAGIWFGLILVLDLLVVQRAPLTHIVDG